MATLSGPPRRPASGSAIYLDQETHFEVSLAEIEQARMTLREAIQRELKIEVEQLVEEVA